MGGVSSKASDYILDWRGNADRPDALFASRLAGLPDFWDPGLGAADQAERFSRILQRQREFVQAFGFLDAAATYQLRFLYHPTRRNRLEVYFLVGIEHWRYAEDAWRLFHASFPGDLDFRLEMIPAAQVESLVRPVPLPPNSPLYHWRPTPTTVALPDRSELTWAQPIKHDIDSKVPILRTLTQQSEPLLLIYTLQPVKSGDYALQATIERWREHLGVVDTVLALGTTAGGLGEMDARYTPAPERMVRMELGRLNTGQIEDTILESETQRRLARLFVGQRQLFQQARDVALRLLQNNTFYFCRIMAVTPRQLPAELGSAVALDLAHGTETVTAGRWLTEAVAPEATHFGALFSIYERVRLVPSDFGRNGYTPYADILDEHAAASIICAPLLPRGGIPGIPGYPANPFASWQLQEPGYVAGGLQRPLVLGSYVDSRTALIGRSGQATEIQPDDLTRHALVTGSTGAGKSTTCKRLLYELHRQGVPFLVIEPVKDEYPDLAFSPEFLAANSAGYPLIYRLGEQGSRLWFNPFYVRRGTSLNMHLSYLQSCFFAAFPMPGIFSIVFSRVLEEAYKRKAQEKWGEDQSAWLVDGIKIVRDDLDDACFPTLADLEAVAKPVIEGLKYAGEFRSNLDAAIRVRLQHLQSGVVGSLLKPQPGAPSVERNIAALLREPVILQLAAIGDKSEKALLMAFLLSAMYEYYALEPSTPHLRHLTLIEEAHVLLENVPRQQSEDSANTRGKAIELFADMLAEIRSRGEGLVIAEQLPSKLMLEAIKNTNLKVMHRLTARDDREVLGAAMNLNEQQSRFATTLQRGQAIVFREGLSEPALVQVRDLPIAAGQRTQVDHILSQQKWDREQIHWPVAIWIAFDAYVKSGRRVTDLPAVLSTVADFLRSHGIRRPSIYAQLWALQRLTGSSTERAASFRTLARQGVEQCISVQER